MKEPTSAQRLSARYADHYGEMQPNVLRYLIAWTLLMRDSFDGDLDMMIVLAVIGDRALKEPMIRDWSYRDVLNTSDTEVHIPLTNRKSIADSTGIPRENVRRKVASLIARGWVVETPDGSLLPTHASTVDLDATTVRSFDILGRLADAIIATRSEKMMTTV